MVRSQLYCESVYIDDVGPCSSSLLHSGQYDVITMEADHTAYIGLNHWRPDKNFPDDIFKWIFLNENIWISIKNSFKFVPKGLIANIPALIQIMA